MIRTAAITDIDVQGVEEYVSDWRQIALRFSLCRQIVKLTERLKSVTQLKKIFAEWPKRHASAVKELAYALEVPYYHAGLSMTIWSEQLVTEELFCGDVFKRQDDERLVARNLLNDIIIL